MAKPSKPPAPGAIPLAKALAAGIAGQPPGFRVDTVPVERPGGILEAGAHFDVMDADGRRWRVLVSRQA